MDEQLTFEFEPRPTIKGFPELRWTGKRPYRSTQYYPTQLRESYGEEQNGWINKIFWGDNLQVMSHMLRDFRGKIGLSFHADTYCFDSIPEKECFMQYITSGCGGNGYSEWHEIFNVCGQHLIPIRKSCGSWIWNLYRRICHLAEARICWQSATYSIF